MTAQVEKHTFQAEVNQVLSIVVNSLYSNREVFLRELISNASDALDKLSFRALTEHDVLGDDAEPRIEILGSKDAGTLMIRDNGIGMTKDEMIENLGTIARSGSRRLMESLSSDADQNLSLIGQFGVGFYSAFLVADRVTVTSRAPGTDEAWQWQSEAAGEFTIEPSEKEARGTNIILHLKEDCVEFVEEWTVKNLVRKYSDYVRHPIRLQVERTEAVGDEKNEDGTPKETTVVKQWETVNQASALWTRPKSEVEDEQYQEFYRHLSHDWDDPLAWTHFKVEGTQELTGLLFLPKNAPFDLADRTNQRGVRLFVKRVFIMDDCEELLPEWLRFVRGVIDSEDLPLNVSREILQQDRTTRLIRKQVVAKSLALLQELADEGETTVETEGEGDEAPKTRNRYLEFWAQFGKILKEGLHFDPENKDQLAELLRFQSSRSDAPTSLRDYFNRMPSGQPAIYFITADNVATCRSSPHLEALEKAGYEVLFMTDAIDEWVVQALTEYDDKKLVSAAKGALDLPESDDDKKEREKQESELGDVLERVKGALDDRIKEVRLTNRLTESPACLVADEHAMSPHIERMLRANGQEVPEQKRTLELNPTHPVVTRLKDLEESDLSRWSGLLLDQALLAEGTMPADPAAFAKAIAELMQQASR